MKRILASLLLLLAGCAPPAITTQVQTGPATLKHYQTIEIEGCEYIAVENSRPDLSSYNLALAHKGNCKNPIHNHNR